MNLVSHIIQILENDHEITLPSLGKFQLIFKPVIIDDTTEKKSPPYYAVVFSQQFDINNETIFRQISISESIEENIIRKEYTTILSKWKTILKEENHLFLENLGTFSADKEKITFEIADNCIFNFKNFGLPII